MGVSYKNRRVHPVDIGFATFFELEDGYFFRFDWVAEPTQELVDSATSFLRSHLALSDDPPMALSDGPPITRAGNRRYGDIEINRVLTRVARFNLDVAAPQPIVQVTQFFADSLIKHLQKNPTDLHSLGRRDFEKLVAQLFDGFGYEVELTKQTKDGGVDIIALKHVDRISLKYLIECKRPDKGNHVAVNAVRELFGVLTHLDGSKMLLVTTGHFSKDAMDLFDAHPWKVEPKVYDDLVTWIDDYLDGMNTGDSGAVQ